MASNKQTRRVIVRLLDNMGNSKEVRQYLKRFADLDGLRFAVVKVGGAIIDSHLNELASALTFLQQVGLTPIVIHGGGPQLNAALAEQSIEYEVRDGFRVTTTETLRVARKVFQGENLRLTQALRDAGSHATSLTSGVFEAQLLDRERYGMVGEVTDVNLDPLRSVVNAHHIPVISPLAETPDGQILNINGDVAASELVKAVQPFKIIFLSATGGILDADGKIISSVNLSTDYEELMRQEWLHSGMRLKLEQIHEILAALPRDSSVSITRPSLLARELFTHRGSGTLVRMGESVRSYLDWSEVDQPRLRELLESSFNKTLKHDYFDTTDLTAAYISDSYRAAAIICPAGSHEPGLMRLDKFAVTAKAQGEGIGKALWDRLRRSHPSLYWRARPDNPIANFYARQADGFVRTDEWLVYWYGIDDLARVPHIVDLACGGEVTMLEEGA